MTSPSIAGSSRINITPPAGAMLESYHRAHASTEVLDPLYATVLALAGGGQDPFILVGIDHVGLLVAETDRLRIRIAAKVGTSENRVMICFSHTHSGPRATPEYLATLEAPLAEAAEQALAEARPARLGWGIGQVAASVNRRHPATEERSTAGPAQKKPPDQRLGVLFLEDIDRQPIAIFFWYGAHANVLKGDSNVVSADWPGAARAFVEKSVGCPVLVAVGAAGNVNPRWRGSREALYRMGDTIGNEALRVLANIETMPLTQLQTSSVTIPLRMRPIPEETKAETLAAEAAKCWKVSTDEWLSALRQQRMQGQIERSLPLEIHAVRINQGVLGGIPMEPFTEIGQSVAGRFPGKIVLFGGYTNGWIGYLPTPAEYAAGGYEIEWGPVVYGAESGWLTPAVPEAASEVADAACHLIEQLMETH